MQAQPQFHKQHFLCETGLALPNVWLLPTMTAVKLGLGKRLYPYCQNAECLP